MWQHRVIEPESMEAWNRSATTNLPHQAGFLWRPLCHVFVKTALSCCVEWTSTEAHTVSCALMKYRLQPMKIVKNFALELMEELHKFHETCNYVTFYFMRKKKSFSDISRKCFLPNMIRAVTSLLIFGKMYILPYFPKFKMALLDRKHFSAKLAYTCKWGA